MRGAEGKEGITFPSNLFGLLFALRCFLSKITELFLRVLENQRDLFFFFFGSSVDSHPSDFFSPPMFSHQRSASVAFVCFFFKQDSNGFVKTHFAVAPGRAKSNAHTCAEVSIRQRLQDGVHGSHVEDEAQLRHAHGDETQHEDGAEDALHKGLIWKGGRRAQTEGDF